MTTLPKIIGLVGPSGAGKSETARVLVNTHGYRLAPMAGPLKKMLMAGGLHHSDVYGARKETPNTLLGGRTPRHAMQTLGTEWGRGMIHPDIWVNMWVNAYERVTRITHTASALQPVVVDDVRFENEVVAIHKLGGVIIKVARQGVYYSTAHDSERGVSAAMVDYVVFNTGDLIHLKREVDNCLYVLS